MKRGNTLVATLATVAIILVLIVILFKGSSVFGFQKPTTPARADKLGKTVLGRVRYEAKDDVCRNNLSQIRTAIQVAQTTNDDACPSSLTELRLPSEMLRCPIGKEPYDFDPSACRVSCPHPGHEKY